MERKKNVLIFPGGTEIGLEIRNSLKDCKDISLYSAGNETSNHAPYVFKNHFIVPDVHSNDWIRVLNQVVGECNIDYIFPAHDDVLVALAKNTDKINTVIISSPPQTCLVTRSKTKTYNRFKNLLPMPKLYNNLSEIDHFPVFIKPDEGQGSQDSARVDDTDTLKILLRKNPKLIVLQYLSGKEYTVDCFTDRKKGLLFCGGRERVRTRSGISMNSKPVGEDTNAIFRKYADLISRELDLYGAWFFQVKLDTKDNYNLLEIAPRIGGTMATHRVLGVNFPLLSIYEQEGIDIEIMLNKNDVEVDRALINRYKHNISYDKVYVDLDDTLIIDDTINTQLIRFLYQSINKGCKVILISKTDSDIDNVLKKWRLINIFDEIILLKKDALKVDYIDPDGAIFIDDSFSERSAAFRKMGIPTFDCSMIELLMDDRV